jgi:ABC-type Zn uptake system ZnuABC Zn-binding protein ZnuA
MAGYVRWIIALALLAACGAPAARPESADTTQKLKVVATTTIVGDVVQIIGADAIELTVLLPPGVDPHGFNATPQDAARVAEADVLFINGLGLEEFLDTLIANAGGDAEVVSVSDSVPVREGGDEHEHAETGDDEHADEEHAAHTGIDPHVWMDPLLVKVWASNIAAKLSERDPANAELYAENARVFRAQLDELDGWIKQQVAQVAEPDRKLVTDHGVFGYFADRYGFEQIGAVIPGYSTSAEPSAQELAQLEDAIRELDVKAIFVGNTVNPAIEQRVADDTHTQLVLVYAESLSEPDGAVPHYIDLMRFTVGEIVNALKR